MTTKLNKFHLYWIMFKSAALTIGISAKTIFEVYMKIFHRSKIDRRLKWWSEKLLSYMKASCKVVNPHNFQFEEGKNYVIMSNHSSNYDIPLIFVSLKGSIRMLAKKELFKVPIWGKGMVASEFISVDRQNRRQAIKDLREAKTKMESGIILWVAPEGTRSRSGKLGKFKKGGFHIALQTGATIIPVGIRNSGYLLSPKTMVGTRGVEAEVHIGKPIDASNYDRKETDKLIEDVRFQVRELGGYTEEDIPQFNPYDPEQVKLEEISSAESEESNS